MTNIRSYLPKKEIVETVLEDHNTDIAVFTESWLTPDIQDAELLQDNRSFHFYRRDRIGRRGGGILALVKSNIPSALVEINCRSEIICLKICLPSRTNLVIACYRAPDTDQSFITDLHCVLQDLHSRLPHANFILCGDFNYPDIDWEALTASSRQSKDFLELVLTFNLFQAVHEPTRGSNILDLILVSSPELIQSLSQSSGLSDHSLLFFDLTIEISAHQPSVKYIRDYRNADLASVNSDLDQFFAAFLLSMSTRSVNENWCLFKHKLLSLIDAYVPLICIRGDATKPWFSNALRKLSRKKKRLFRNAKNSTSSVKWNKYFASLREYTQLLRSSKRKFYNHDLLDIMRSNPKKFWNLITPNKNSSYNISLRRQDGTHVPLSERSDTMNSYFTSVFTHEPPDNRTTLPQLNFDSMPPVTITSEGISKLIENLKPSTSPGPDNIPAKILKGTKELSSQILQLIFDQSLKTGQIPDDWKTSKVVPVFKTGDRSDPSNYRPISLTCISCKLFEHILYSNIADHLDKNSFFFPKQHGFRAGFSCETQLFEFTTDLHLSLDSLFQTDAIYLDFSKAFDRVPHQRLICKLACLSLDPLVFSWIRCFLTNRSQFTVIANHVSATTVVISGVPQGSVLAPLLFLIFINDLPSGISSSVRLFADDCVIYRRISDNTDQELLQDDLNKIQKWCSDWLMQLNISKCKCMHISRKRSITNFQYSLNSVALSVTNSYRYLGVEITNKLTWSDHIIKLCASTSRALGFIRRSLSMSPAPIRQQAYETFIRAKMEYASAIWNPHQVYLIQLLEAIQNRAARFITSQYSSRHSVTNLKSSLGLEPLAFRRKVSILCLFHKLYFNFPALRQTLLSTPLRSSRRLFNSLSIQRLHGSSNAFNKSFLPIAIEEWNYLPETVVIETNPTRFRQLITDHLIQL